MPGPVGARDILDAVGLLVGAALGALAGAGALVGHAVQAATGTGAGDGTAALVLLAVGLGAGALMGLSLADRRVARAWPRAQALVAAGAGLAAGFACAFGVIALTQGTILEPAGVVTVVALPVAGALGAFRRLRDG